MIGEGQSDLRDQGVFLSLILILLLNLLLIEAGLAAVLEQVTFAKLGHLLWTRSLHCYAGTGHGIAAGSAWTWHGLREISARLFHRRG